MLANSVNTHPIRLHYIEHIILVLRQFGVMGLFGLALIDSAGVPTGGGPDWMIVLLLGTQQIQVDSLVAVPLAVLGSTVGCIVPYYLGCRGGEVLLRHVNPVRSEAVRAKIHRYGFWSMALSVLVPPPYPMKLFMVSAGVFRMPVVTFVSAVLLGRCVRYSTVAYLAMRYGERAIDAARGHAPMVLGIAAAAAVAAVLARQAWRRWKR